MLVASMSVWITMVDDNEKDLRRYPSRYKNERVKSRNLSEKKRRDQFNLLINELCSMVTSSTRKMDKSSVLRSTISFLRSHNELSVQSQTMEVQENWKPSFLSNEEFTHLMLEGEMCSSVFDMVHECDQPSLYKLISNASSSANSNSPTDANLSLLVNMKRGPISSHLNPTCEFIRLDGAFHHWETSPEGLSTYNFECDSNSCSSACSQLSSPTTGKGHFCFVAMAKLQTPHLLRIVDLPDESKSEFTSRHSLEWKFLFLDYRAPPIIGYLPFELLGTSGYDYYHVDDLENVAACHEALMHTGEGTSCFYRFLTKGQQWIWLQTRYYITYHQWNSKPEFIVCTHSVISSRYVQDSLHTQQTRKNQFGKEGGLSGMTSRSNLTIQSSCMSPASSLSSQGSLSSDHLERCSVATSSIQNNSVIFEGHCREENSTPCLSEDVYQAKNTEQQTRDEVIGVANDSLTAQQTETEAPLMVPSLDPVLVQPSSILRAASVVALQPFLELPGSQMLTTNIPEMQCQTSQSERLQQTFIVTPNQSQLQDYLRHRHQLLQQQILIQQEELRRVSEQLMLVQFVAPNMSTTSSISCQPTISLGPGITGTDVSAFYNVQKPSPLASNESGIIKSEIAYASTQLPVATSASLVNPEGSIRLVSTTHVMPLQLPQDESSAVVSQGFSSSHSLQLDT